MQRTTYLLALTTLLVAGTGYACRDDLTLPAPPRFALTADTILADTLATCGAITTAKTNDLGLCPSAVLLTVGTSFQFQTGGRRSRGTRIPDDSLHWSVADSTVATVDARGIVTARAVGETWVRVWANKNPGNAPLLTDSAHVSVIAQDSAPTDSVPADTVPQDTVPTPPADTVPPDTVPTVPPAGAVLPELPRATVDTRMPPVSRVVPVAAGADLQAALDAAQPGDAVTLACGATWTGNYTLPNKAGWVVLTSACPAPPEGTRRGPTPTSAIVSPNALSALKLPLGAGFWRLVNLEVVSDPQTTNYAFGLVVAVTDGMTSAGQFPHDWIIDRTWIHPRSDTTGIQRCVALNAVRAAVIDSYLAGCHYRGADAQAIAVWDSPGPIKIDNNHLEGSGENIMFGGAKPKIAGVIPSDLTVTRNHVVKPLGWIGTDWMVKNLFETKNARRLLVEGNVFENNWADGQTGVAILLKSSMDSGSESVLEDVTFRYNIVRNSPKGLETLGHRQGDEVGEATYDEAQARNRRVRIAHNLFENIGDADVPNGGQFWLFMIYRGGEDFSFDHNTFANGRTTAFLMFSGKEPGTGLHFTNNIATLGTYGIRGDGSISTSGEGQPAFDAYAPGAVVAGNVIGLDGHKLSIYPAGNSYPASRDVLGLVDGALPAGSPYLGTGTDGTDPGADLTTLRAKTAGVAP